MHHKSIPLTGIVCVALKKQCSCAAVLPPLLVKLFKSQPHDALVLADMIPRYHEHNCSHIL